MDETGMWTGCKNQYGTKTDGIYNQSTTGNISGIFDMSGGYAEFVMAYTIKALDTEKDLSGFTSGTLPDSRYIDIYYHVSTRSYKARILGDATGEMGPFSGCISSWYGDTAVTHPSSVPWLIRGGSYSTSNKTGVFHFHYEDGG